MIGVTVFNGGRVATEAVAQESRDPTDRRYTDARHVVDTAIGEVLLQKSNDLPAVNQRLQFRWCTQILEKFTTIAHTLKAIHRIEKVVFIAFLLAGGFVAIGFHAFGSFFFVLM